MPKRTRGPAPQPKTKPERAVALKVPLQESGIGSEQFWLDEIEQADRRVQKEIPLWRKNLERYKGGKPTLANISTPDIVGVNVDFPMVESKKAQLFFQTPDVQVTANRDDVKVAAPIVRAVINDQLGPNGVDAKRLADEVMMDILCPAGIGPTKIGFDNVKVMVTIPTGALEMDPANPTQPLIDPATQQPKIKLDPATGKPETTDVPRTIWSKFYWRRISPADFRMAVGFTSTRYDESPWLGFKFRPDADMLRELGIDADSISDGQNDVTLVSDNDKEFLRGAPTGMEIWYRAHVYDSTVKNPELIRRLVIIEGRKNQKEAVLVHEDSPYQVFGPNGEFVNGMLGYPVHPAALRVVSDTAYVPSDSTISRNQVDELSKGRSQMVRQRDRNLPLRGYDETRVSKKTLEKIEKGEIQSLIGFKGAITADSFTELVKSAYPNEDFQFNAIIERDIEKLWALGANQNGLQQETGRTATELALIQRGTDTRLAADRERLMAWFVGGVKKLFALIQMFTDHQQLVAVVGDDGAKRIETWDKEKIRGDFAFTIKPDSSIRQDAAEDRELKLRVFNLLANHPLANAAELLKMIAEAFGLDPTRFINAAPPTPKEEDKFKVNISIKGEDFNPNLPQYPNILRLMQKINVDGMMAAPPPPGGMPGGPQVTGPVGSVPPVPPINQHQAQLTGHQSGPAPLV